MGCKEKFIENGRVVERDCYSNELDSSEKSAFGPGTELKKLLKKIGIVAEAGCACNARANIMDMNELREPGWCLRNIQTIVGWLKEEADKRKLIFIESIVKLLIYRAIRNAKRA